MAKLLAEILPVFVRLVRRPEDYLNVQSSAATDITDLLKNLYDYTKNVEDSHVSGDALPELIVEDFDQEQIWQELELQNSGCSEKFITDIAGLVARKRRLVFANNLEKSEQELDSVEVDVASDKSIVDGSFEAEFPSNDELSEGKEELISDEIRRKSWKKKGPSRVSEVDDKFFKLSELEEFLEQEDKREAGQHDSSDESVDLFRSFDNEEDQSDSLRGTLRGHNGWVTQIATNPKYPDMILSCSRDKTLIVWKLTRDETNYGVPQKRLYGHSHFVSDVVLSSDGNYALSGSWDKTLRLWDLAAGRTTRRFEDHTKDVLSVAFSVDNRQIVSGSRDKTIKLWNTLAECKYTIQDDGHSDWVSCVRFSPNHSNPIIVSAGWDRVVKVWNLTNCKLKINHIGHTGYLNTVTVSPDGSLCASGGKDCKAMLWDLNDGKHLHTLDHNDIITALCFSPNRYWLCAAFGPSIKIWDLESKDMVEELRPEVVSQPSKAEPPQCLSLAWSTDGQTLFAGYSDNTIRVWQVSVSAR